MGKQCHVSKLPVHWAGRLRNLIGLGLWAVAALVQAQGVMTTSGSFSVNESGAATYTIPIQIPPGTGGMEPRLALAFNSQGGNGPFGVGWNLSGLSAITRCQRTMAQDGVRGSVNYDSNDRYCLDGQRLIAISGANGANGAEYRTERESFSKVVSYGSAGNGPASFKVWTKDGLIMEYGATADSAIEAQGKTSIAVWAVNKVSDTKGNYFTVTYTEENANGAYYPARIDYTGNANTGLAPNNSVRFVYETRSDIVAIPSPGALGKNNVRLKQLQAYFGSALSREYRLTYTTGLASGRSRVSSLTECNGAGECLAPLYFDSESNAPSPQNLTLSGHKVYDGGWSLGDIFGNGWPVFYTHTKAGAHYATQRNAGATSGGSWTWTGGHGVSDGGWALGDLFGEGRQIYYTVSKAGTHYATRLSRDSTGGNNHTLKNWTWTGGHKVYDAGWQLADLFGEGRQVFYTNTKTGTHYATRLNENGTVQNWTWTGGHKVYDGGWKVVDLFGDGRPVFYTHTKTGTHYATRLNSDGTVQNWTWTGGHSEAAGGWSLGDFFGDGRPVFYTHTKTGTHYATRLNADGTVQNWTWTGGHSEAAGGWQLGDLFGDGRQVFYTHTKAGTHYATRLNINGTIQNWTWTGGHGMSDAGWQLVDLFGDGRQVYYTVASTGTHYTTSFLMVKPDSVVKIRNSLNSAITLSEQSYLHSFSLAPPYSMSPAVYPVINLEVPIYVVSSVSVDNGIGGTQTTRYSYHGLRAELGTGRGLLGFAAISTSKRSGTNSLDLPDIWTVTEYRQDWPYVGLPSKVARLYPGTNYSGNWPSQTDITYACLDPATGGACTVAAGKRYFPYASQSVERGHDLNGAGFPTITTTQQFDAWGNATVVKVSTSDGHEKITTNTYSNDATKWHLGRLLRSKVQSTAPYAYTPQSAPSPSQYTVTYDFSENGGTSATKTSAFVNSGAAVDLTPTAKKEDYAVWQFVGWNTNKDATTGLTSYTMPAANVRLYAIYKVTLTTTLKDVSGTTPTTRTVAATLYNKATSGNAAIPAANTYTGWTARGWRMASVWSADHPTVTGPSLSVHMVSGNYAMTTAYGNMVFYGLYQRNATASYNANGGTTTPPSQTGIRYVNSYNTANVENPSITLPGAITRAGYTFDGWVSSAGGAKFNAGATVQLSGDTTFTAAWK